MTNSWRWISGSQLRGGLAALAAAGLCVSLASTLSAQLPPLSPAHLNPIVAKLAAGQTVYGILTQDISKENARALGARDTDFVFIDMEHAPLNIDAFTNFVTTMNNKAYALKNGAQPRAALIVRMPPYAWEHNAWVVKQALDLGAMGFVFNTVETKEDAEFAVRSMRYPPWRAFPNTQKGPVGFRGYSPNAAFWAWGIEQEEYRRRADLWPLNPDGDLVSIMIIETQTGVRNVNEIAQVPGVTVLSAAAGADLSSSYGVPVSAPEIEAARQSILQACKTHSVTCWISPSDKADEDRRLKEGWQMIRTPDGLPFR